MQSILEKIIKEITDFYTYLLQHPVLLKASPEEISSHLAATYDFKEPIPLDQVMKDVSRMMRQWIVHTTHPRYFGLFNPTSNLASIAADTLVVLYNPQDIDFLVKTLNKVKTNIDLFSR